MKPDEELYEEIKEDWRDNIPWHAIGVYRHDGDDAYTETRDSTGTKSTADTLYQLHIPEDEEDPVFVAQCLMTALVLKEDF